MEFHEVGDIFSHNDVLLRVVERFGCGGCYFSSSERCGSGADISGCSNYARPDKKSIVFEQIAERKTAEPVTPIRPELCVSPLVSEWVSDISAEWQKQIHDAALDAFVFRFWDMSNAALSRVCGVSRGKIKRIRKKILRKNKESV